MTRRPRRTARGAVPKGAVPPPRAERLPALAGRVPLVIPLAGFSTRVDLRSVKRRWNVVQHNSLSELDSALQMGGLWGAGGQGGATI